MKNKLLLIFQTVFSFFFMLVLIDVLAGRTDYWPGLVFSILLGVTVFFQTLIFQQNPDLAKERRKPGPGVKIWDRIFYIFFAPLVLAIMVVGVLDSGRYGWSGDLPLWFIIKGEIIFTLSVGLFLWAMRVNRWFSSMVRIQKDRGQRVVSKAPYNAVRHPGYVGAILMCFGIALSFGSLYAVIPAILASLLLVIRTNLEDKALQKELPGYSDYAKLTRYRLIPHVW